MADPLSITTGILALISTVGKTSIAVTEFVKTCREARADLLGVGQELSTLKQILEWLKDDTDAAKQFAIPESLTKQILPIISDCDRVLKKIDKVVKEHTGTLGPPKWALSGKKDINSLREALSAHRGALSVTLETLSIVLARDIKNDTMAIREDTTELKLGQEQIIAKIAELQAQLPQSIRDNTDTAYVIQQYLDGLTSYAETVCNPEIEWSDNESVAVLRDPSPVRKLASDDHKGEDKSTQGNAPVVRKKYDRGQPSPLKTSSIMMRNTARPPKSGYAAPPPSPSSLFDKIPPSKSHTSTDWRSIPPGIHNNSDSMLDDTHQAKTGSGSAAKRLLDFFRKRGKAKSGSYEYY